MSTLRPDQGIQVASGEVVPVGEGLTDERWGIKNTLENPDIIASDASEERLRLAAGAGALESGVDAAQSIQARNSLEKMLAYQLAAAHGAAMKLFERVANKEYPPVEHARLTNAAARLLDSFQTGLLALQKLRTGGRQTVVVQHVQVADGGQAVVAGNLEAANRGADGGEGE
jgi:hypothetical protein